MKQYISKSALVAEIERKMNLCKQILLRSRTRQDDDYHQGNIEAYEVVISLLDTLEVKEVGEEPTSNDLEEAVKKYLTSLRKSHFEGYDIERAFKKGAQWQKEQTVKEVDLEGISKNYALNNSPWDDCMLEMQNAFKDGFELGLKVQKGE